MKSFKGEIKAIERQTSIKHAKSMLGSVNNSLGNGSPCYSSHSKAKLHQTNLNNTETTTCEAPTSRTQPQLTQQGEFIWRELSFNMPNQIIRIKDFDTFSAKKYGSKARPMSSFLSSPFQKGSNKKEKSTSQHHHHSTNSMMKQHLNSSRSAQKNHANVGMSVNRVKTEEDRITKKKAEKQMQDAAVFDFIQGHLEDLYTDQCLDPYKPNMNLQKRIYLTENSQISDQSMLALEQKLKFKQMSEEEKIEEEYQIQKKKGREENKLYFKKLYKIQKSALSQYLQGVAVENNVIKCHKEIVNPLAAYVEQKQRENYQRHQQELNRSFIRNSKEPAFESQQENRAKQNQCNIKVFKNKGNLKSQTVCSLGGSNEKGVGKSVEQVMQQKDQMSQQATVTFLDNFLKGERVYFEKLADIQKNAKQNFIQDIHVNQKFYFDQLTIPNQQHMQEVDLKIQRNPNVMKALQQQLLQSQQNQNTHRNSLLQQVRKESFLNALVNKQLRKGSSTKRGETSKMMTHENSTFSHAMMKQLSDDTPIRRELSSKKNNAIFFEKDITSKQYEQNNNTSNQHNNINNSSYSSKSNVLGQMLDRYLEKQDEVYLQQKEQIVQKRSYEESISKMNTSKNQLLHNLFNIKSINQLTDFHKTIFSYVKNNQIKELESCLQVQPQIVHLQDQTGKSLLHWASMRGFVDIVNLLIGYKANLNLTDLGNKMPKDLALLHNQQQIYGILQKEEKYTKQIKMQKNYNQQLINSNSILSVEMSPQIQQNISIFNASSTKL